MNETRYIYEEQPLTEEEARTLRAREIEYRIEGIRSMQEEIRQLEQSLQELRNSPLPKTVKVQIRLNPGDEGYEDAPVRMIVDDNPRKYLFQ